MLSSSVLLLDYLCREKHIAFLWF